MNADRYVVLGLAHVRSTWFTEVARWATSGSLPIEFVKCVSIEELRARYRGGRPFSAALLDGRLPAVDRDLIATLHDGGIPSLVVPAEGDGPDWSTLGAAATLPTPLTRAALLDGLATHARLIGPVDGESAGPSTASLPPAWLGRLVAVTSRSSAGASTVAAGLAQALADDPRHAGDVVLADLARHAHQALLHDARDVVPGVQELVEAHRSGRPSSGQVRASCFEVPARGYRLLLGLRRPGDWVTIRSRALDAALEGLRASARLVVADIDDDLEGEAATGSLDIEDRNLLARTVTRDADLVLAVATATTTGLHGLAHQVEELRLHGVPGGRILTVITRVPRGARARSELTRTVAELTGGPDRVEASPGPVFVPDRRGVDAIHRDVSRFPASLCDPVARVVLALLDDLPARADDDLADAGPVPVAPGSLGTWSDDDWSDDDWSGGEEASS